MTTKAKMQEALQKIANLPAQHKAGKPNPILRAKRLALIALGAKPAAVRKFTESAYERAQAGSIK